MQIITLHERESRRFARDDLIEPDGTSRILPQTRDLKAFEIRDTPSGFVLQPRGYIGYLPLTSEIALNLQPKVPLNNLWKMLSIADEGYERLVPILRTYGTFRQLPPHLMLARAFCYFLRKIVVDGVAKDYTPSAFEGYFRPRPEFSKTLGKFLSRGNVTHVVGLEHVLSPNIKANQLLKKACIDFLRLIPVDQNWNAERLMLLDALNSLDAVHPRAFEQGDNRASHDVPSWLRDPYDNALQVYSVYCGHDHFGFAFEATGTMLPSFLFKLDDIFESFLRNALRSSMRDMGINVVDGNKPKHQRRLFEDNNQFKVKPDIILKSGKSIPVICEVKYKPKIEENDRYQLISHVLANDADVGVWISPATEASVVGPQYVGRRERKLFYHYRFDLNEDVDEQVLSLKDHISQLMNSASRQPADQT